MHQGFKEHLVVTDSRLAQHCSLVCELLLQHRTFLVLGLPSLNVVDELPRSVTFSAKSFYNVLSLFFENNETVHSVAIFIFNV
jgi:hypothetical protein